MSLSLLGLMSAACCVCTYISFELTLLVSSGRTSAYQRRLLAQVHRIASSARGESAWAHARRLSCSTSSCSEHDPLFKRSPAPPRHRAHKWHMVSTSRLALMYFFPFIFALLLLLFLLLLSNVLFIHSSCHSSSSLCTSIARYGSVFAAAILRETEHVAYRTAATGTSDECALSCRAAAACGDAAMSMCTEGYVYTRCATAATAAGE